MQFYDLLITGIRGPPEWKTIFKRRDVMKIKGIVWLGTRTDQFEQMTAFCRNLLGLPQRTMEPGFAVYEMSNGDLFEVFGAEQSMNTFMSHPVAGFLVDDIVAARA